GTGRPARFTGRGASGIAGRGALGGERKSPGGRDRERRRQDDMDSIRGLHIRSPLLILRLCLSINVRYDRLRRRVKRPRAATPGLTWAPHSARVSRTAPTRRTDHAHARLRVPQAAVRMTDARFAKDNPRTI